ncbi:MAG TPA: alpha/beta hydrolase [Gammaproteobacteria bacterium]|nr:alpha/beta hydrolase [Gammaproteobacteria bacterium]
MTTIAFNPSLVKPEIAAYLQEQSKLPIPATLTPELVRAGFAANFKKFSPYASFFPVDSVKDYDISEDHSLLVRVYTPTADHQKLPLLVYYHGGGWVGNNVTTHDSICRLLAKRCGCIVVSVDYPLAPEHKFPEIIQQCFAALTWVFEHAEKLSGDVNRIGVAGDSSGANLATIMTLMAKTKLPPIIYQALICPVTDLTTLNTPSYTTYSNFGLSRDKMAWFIQCYLQNAADAADPLASPLLAPDLSGLPPTLVVASEFDVLRDDAERYAVRLQQAGVPTVYHCMKKMIHSGIFWALGLPVIAEEINFISDRMTEGLSLPPKA